MVDKKPPPRKQPAKKAAPKPARTPATRRAQEGTHPAIASVTPINKPRAVGRHKNAFTPEAIRVAERRGRALRYKRAGLTYQQIVDQLRLDVAAGRIDPIPDAYDYRACRRDIERMYDDIIIKPTDAYLTEKLDQLQSIYAVLYARMASNGKDQVAAALAAMRNIDIQLKLTGAYAPVRIAGEIEFTLPSDPAEIAEAVRMKLDRILPTQEPPAIEAEVVDG